MIHRSTRVCQMRSCRSRDSATYNVQMAHSIPFMGIASPEVCVLYILCRLLELSPNISLSLIMPKTVGHGFLCPVLTVLGAMMHYDLLRHPDFRKQASRTTASYLVLRRPGKNEKGLQGAWLFPRAHRSYIKNVSHGPRGACIVKYATLCPNSDSLLATSYRSSQLLGSLNFLRFSLLEKSLTSLLRTSVPGSLQTI